MTSVTRRLLSAALAAMGCMTSAHAADEITVVITGTGAGRPATITFDASEAINAPNGLPTIETTDSRVNIYSSITLASAGRVTLVAAAGTRTTDLEIFLGVGAFPTTQFPLSEVLTDWAGIAPLPTNLVDKVRLAGAISGDLTNSLSVKEIYRLEIGDELQAAVEGTGSGTAIARINFASSTATGTITASNSTSSAAIFDVQASSTTGVLAGAISTPNGGIANIVAAGDIAITHDPGIEAHSGIETFQAGNVIAAIVANSNGGSGNVTDFEIAGDFFGSLRAQSLDIGDPGGTNVVILSVQGGARASVVFDGDVWGSIGVFGCYVQPGDCSRSLQSVSVAGNVYEGMRFAAGVETIEVNGDLDLQSAANSVLQAASIGALSVGGRIRGVTLRVSGTIDSLSAGSFVSSSLDGGLADQVPLPTSLGGAQISGDCLGGILLHSFDGLFVVGGSLRYAGVYLANPTNALEGQFVVNAANESFNVWDSGFRVNTGFGGEELSPKPHYSNKSGNFGGGAVGLVPYALYHHDCSPVHDDEWDTNPGTDPLLNTQFSHWVNPSNEPEITPKSALMRFYGPINAPANVPPLSVWLWLHDQFWWDVTDLCEFDVNGPTIAIHGVGSNLLPSGFYAALARTTGSSRVTCAGTLVPSNPPSVLANSVDSQNNPVVQYNFYLFPDCDKDNELDTGTVDCGPCLADYDDGSGNGVRDGGVTIDDLLFYLPAYADGDIICDIDDGTSTGTPDYGVTIDDLLYYIIRYGNGC